MSNSPLNLGQNFYTALGMSESSGNYSSVNQYGYVGMYQFGELALQDAGFFVPGSQPATNNWVGTWTGVDGINSLSQFLASPTAQNDAAQAYAATQWGYITHFGLDTYIGQTIDGVTITQSGLVAGAWLVGIGGLMKFLNSNGSTVPTDGNGTPITNYLSQFAQFSSPSMTGGADSPQSGSGYFIFQYANGLSFGGSIAINPYVCTAFDQSLFNSGSDPLAIDLTGGGIHTIGAAQSGVMFDTTGSGNTVSTGWVANGTGVLVYDPNGATTLTNETQLLTSFQQLATLDTDGDGLINASDPAFANLRVWVGAPTEGSTNSAMAAGQMETLQQLGIVGISLKTTNSWINTGGTGSPTAGS